MNIIAIDPGVSTGIAAATVSPHPDYVSIRYQRVETVSNPAMVLHDVLKYRCRIMLMEDKPAYPSKEGLEPWEAIFHKLLLREKCKLIHGSLSISSASDKIPLLFMIRPSQWKPFMRSHLRDLPKGIKDTKHEFDAMAMLHYFVQVNNIGKEITYA